MTFNENARKRFCEDVGNHVLSRKIVDFDLLPANDLANPEMSNINVLHTAMVLRVIDGRNR